MARNTNSNMLDLSPLVVEAFSAESSARGCWTRIAESLVNGFYGRGPKVDYKRLGAAVSAEIENRGGDRAKVAVFNRFRVPMASYCEAEGLAKLSVTMANGSLEVVKAKASTPRNGNPSAKGKAKQASGTKQAATSSGTVADMTFADVRASVKLWLDAQSLSDARTAAEELIKVCQGYTSKAPAKPATKPATKAVASKRRPRA